MTPQIAKIVSSPGHDPPRGPTLARCFNKPQATMKRIQPTMPETPMTLTKGPKQYQRQNPPDKTQTSAPNWILPTNGVSSPGPAHWSSTTPSLTRRRKEMPKSAHKAHVQNPPGIEQRMTQPQNNAPPQHPRGPNSPPCTRRDLGPKNTPGKQSLSKVKTSRIETLALKERHATGTNTMKA
ncbi:MAG: hypothetical protein CM15mP120_10790 [Pseudomonadota bacterium]|nr:MAG: hypothetical protein CM15mP120_10790 [Pseudomonadota bacterium]